MKIKNKILISTSSFGACGQQPLRLLKEAGNQVIANPFGRKMTPAEVVKLGKDCIGIIAGVELLNAAVLEALPHLRCISRCGSGTDNIDLEKAKEFKIVVRNTPEGPTRAVAELTLGVILDILRKISLRDRQIRQGKWNKEMGYLLQGKKVGILGLGRIGRAVAELLLRQDAKVAGSDIQPDKRWSKKNKVPLLSFRKLLRESQILTIHISGSPNNRHLIGQKEINSMPRGAYLINLSRGGIVDEQILYQALKKGCLAGAAIDVFEEEPYTGPLRGLDNIVLTPHVGSYASETRLEMEIEAAKNLLEGLKRS
jgi:D-3-phosphoglycerate dehydrogenase